MAFYYLPKEERTQLVSLIMKDVFTGIEKKKLTKITGHFSDEDTYIRKSAYQAIGKIYFANRNLQKNILEILALLFTDKAVPVRQTVVNAAGEIGIQEFEKVEHFFDRGLLDEHHSVRNAVIGSVKKMGGKNPKPVLAWARKYLHHPEKEIRREVCHGIELRGRTHPEDILPLLKELQHDKTARVRNTLIHVLGQIAYKKGCLETVIAHLNSWENKELTKEAIDEIVDVHERYKNFSALTQQQAIRYIEKHYKASAKR